MPNFIFDAPEHHELVFDGKVVAHGGEEFTVSAERAAALAANPAAIPVREPAKALDQLSRPELEELTAARGLDPKQFKNKGELIAALEEPVPDHAPSPLAEDPNESKEN